MPDANTITLSELPPETALIATTTQSLVSGLRRVAPDGRLEFLATVLSSAVGAMPDEAWRQMLEPLEACGQPGCHCHTEMQDLQIALGQMRTGHLRRRAALEAAGVPIVTFRA